MPKKKTSAATINSQTQEYFDAVVDLDDQLGVIIIEGIEGQEKTSDDYDRWIIGTEKILTKLSFLDESDVHKGVLKLSKILKANLTADYNRLLLDRGIHNEREDFDDTNGSFLMNAFHFVTNNEAYFKTQDRQSSATNKKISQANQINRQRNDLSDRFNARRDAIRETFDI